MTGARSPIAEVVVVYDVSCPQCSRIARELPDVLTVPVRVRSCRDPALAERFPTLPAPVRRCAAPAIGTVRGSEVRWWRGLTGAVGLLPVLRRSPQALVMAAVLWRTAVRAGRARGAGTA